MTDQKTSVGEIFGTILLLLLFAAMFAPVVLSEMNAHSGVKSEYTTTKVGWLVYTVTAGNHKFVTIRDRATARVAGTYRGVSYSALTDEFYTKNVPIDLVKDRRYEFKLRCTKIGTLSDPTTNDVCEILSLRERSGARIVHVDDPIRR